MTAKEKAEEIVSKMLPWMLHDNAIYRNAAKQCALIHVNGIIEEYTHRGTSQIWEHPRLEYWNEVKLELEKL